MTSCRPYVKLKNFTLLNINNIPDSVFGVYGFWYRKSCIYIGKAERQPIRVRLNQHWLYCHNSFLNDWIVAKKKDLLFTYCEFYSAEEIDAAERLFIRKFDPRTNKIRYSRG
jgi:hypothetical protein